MRTVRAMVVYESMFGNTESIAAAIAEGLAAEDVEVSTFEVGKAPDADCQPHDLLVVGAPTHAFSLSRHATRADAVRQGATESRSERGLREWLASMKRPANGGQHLAVCFDTRVTKVRHIPKSASTRAGHMLVHNGLTLMEKPRGFLVHDTQGPLEPDELEHARAWGHQLALEAKNRMSVTQSAS